MALCLSVGIVAYWSHNESVVAQRQKRESRVVPSSQGSIPDLAVNQHTAVARRDFFDAFLREGDGTHNGISIFDFRRNRHFWRQWCVQFWQREIIGHWVIGKYQGGVILQSISGSVAEVFEDDDNSRFLSQPYARSIFTPDKNIGALRCSRNSQSPAQNPRLNETNYDEKTGEPSQRRIGWYDYVDGGGCLLCGLAFLSFGCSLWVDRDRAFFGWLMLTCGFVFVAGGIFTMQYGRVWTWTFLRAYVFPAT